MVGRERGSGRRIWVALIAMVVFAAACSTSSDNGADDGPETTDDSAALAVLGDPDPATGEPFVVGSFIDTGGEAVSVEEREVGRSVAEEYVNEYLGGIGVEGRPLEVIFCETRTTAAGATECANQFVQEGVSAFVGETSTGGIAAGIASEAGIPYIATAGATTEELALPGSYSLAGTVLSVLGAPAIYMQQEGLSNIGVLTIDVPSATQPLEALAVPAYEGAGLGLEIIPVAPGTADMTANAAAAADAEAWLVLGDAAFCTTALQAVQTQTPDAPIFVATPCVVPEAAGDLPNGYEGVFAASATRLDPADPEDETFNAAVEVFAGDEAADLSQDFIGDGYISILAFARLMEDYSGDASPASVLEHLDGSTGLLPLSGGAEMTCGDSPVPFIPAFCSMSAWITALDAAGIPASFESVDVVPLFVS